MINHFLYLTLGYVKFAVPARFKDTAVNFLVKKKIRYRQLHFDNDESIVFTVLSFNAAEAHRVFRKFAVPHSMSGVCGLPKYIKKYADRFGVFLGIVLFSFFVILSQRYVWYMDVKGCESISEESVLENLSELGFTYGTNFKKIDFDYLRNRYLAQNDDLCWISINMHGTYAHVEVRELKDPPKTLTEGSVNIVASEKGRIILVESFEGAPVVFPGDSVTKGELLISGIMTSGEDILRYEKADGKVLAEVERRFKVEIPKTKNEKVYTGEEKQSFELIFFKKSVKLSGKCRISDTEYDTIIKKVQLSLFDSVNLPIFIEKTSYRPYVTNISPMSEKDIEDAKKRLVSDRISEITKDAEILETVTSEYETDDKIIVIGTVRCIADIGIQREVQIGN